MVCPFTAHIHPITMKHTERRPYSLCMYVCGVRESKIVGIWCMWIWCYVNTLMKWSMPYALEKARRRHQTVLSVSSLFLLHIPLMNLELGWQPTTPRDTSISAVIVGSQVYMWVSPFFMWNPNSGSYVCVAKLLTTEPYLSQMVMSCSWIAGAWTQVLCRSRQCFQSLSHISIKGRGRNIVYLL